MTSTGYNVMGWQVDAEGQIIQNTVSPLKILSADHMFSQPEATELGTTTGVLDKSDPNLTSANGKILSLSIYDDLGYEYTAKFSIKPFKTATTTTKQVTNTSTTYTKLPTLKETTEPTYTFRIKANDEDQNGSEITKYTTPTSLYDALKKYSMPYDASQNPHGHGLQQGDVIDLSIEGTTGTSPVIEELIALMELNNSTVPTAEQFRHDPDLIGKKILVGKQDITSYTVEENGTSTPLEGITKETLEALREAGVVTWNAGASTYEPVAGYDFMRYESRYYDGQAPSITYTIVNQTTGEKTPVDDALKNVGSDQMGLFLGASKSSDITIYDTMEPVTKTNYIEGQYTIELSEIVDIANDKTPIDFSILGDTSRTLMYDTNDGKFRYIGDEGQTAYDLHLSALGGKFKDINIDFSTTKNVSNEGTSTIGMKAGDEDGAGAGKLLGALKGISIDSSGKIYGSYDNGNTELLGQIAVTDFANASGLEKVGENLYQTTLNSGAFDGIGKDISSLSGSMSTGVLEMSNVDLSAEFTDMITTQRGFQANSRIITTSDTLLEELINLKR
jgi:flagellar hook protein FlgE